jgi:hypothetical protein
MKDRMLRGELCIANDPELAADLARAQELLERCNPGEGRRGRQSGASPPNIDGDT